MNPLKYAFREIFYRKAYSILFIIAISFGSAVLLALAGFEDAVKTSLYKQGRELATADLVVDAPEQALKDVATDIETRWPGVVTAKVRNVFTMVRSKTNDNVIQVALKAPSPTYPLYGEVVTGQGKQLRDVLKPGIVIADPKLLDELGIKAGETIIVGDKELVIKDYVSSRSDRAVSFFEFVPTVFITYEDLESAGLIVAGSRVRDKLFVNLPVGITLEQAAAAIPTMSSSHELRVRTWTTNQPGVFRFLARTLQYLDFIGMLTLALGGLAAAGTLSSALSRSTKSNGMLLAMGAPRWFILKSWLWWVFILTATGLFLALVLGKIMTILLASMYGDFLPAFFKLTFPLTVFLRAALLCFTASIIFTLVPLLKLLSIPPNAVFAGMGTTDNTPWQKIVGAVLAALLIFFLLIWAHTGKSFLAMTFLAGLASIVLVCWATVKIFMSLLVRFGLRARNTSTRLAVRGLMRQGNLNVSVIISLAVSMVMILIIVLLERNISRNFIESFPPSAPNVFFINIQDYQIDQFKKIIGNRPIELHPLIRGRVVSVNGVPARMIQDQTTAKRGQGDRLTREFGFTFGNGLLATDRVVKGNGLWNDNDKQPQVSIHDEFHEKFGINIGDEIIVNILGKQFAANVSSIRHINTSQRQPFFYFYFKPGLIDHAPHTYMGAAHIPIKDVSTIETALSKEFANITSIDLSEVAVIVARIVNRLTKIVTTLGIFAVIAGLFLLIACLWSTMLERIREAVLFRTIGATGQQLLMVYLLEYIFIALAVVIPAMLLSTVSSWAIVTYVIKTVFYPELFMILLSSVTAALVITSISLCATASAFRAEPAEVLRYE